eukprot:1157198-Pelagomonas_calceolata.AAC.8
MEFAGQTGACRVRLAWLLQACVHMQVHSRVPCDEVCWPDRGLQGLRAHASAFQSPMRRSLLTRQRPAGFGLAMRLAWPPAFACSTQSLKAVAGRKQAEIMRIGV